MAKARKPATQTKKAAPVLQRRKEQLAQIHEAIVGLETELQRRIEAARDRELLESVSLGMYEEIEKLTKKAPAEQVTELALEQVNDLIGEAKELMKEDRYIQRLNQFVPAGDLPQLRDVLLVLRQVRQGLERFSNKLKTEYVFNSLKNARIVEAALELYLDGLQGQDLFEALKNRITISQFPSEWQKKDLYGGLYGTAFNFDHLDSIDIQEHFSVT